MASSTRRARVVAVLAGPDPTTGVGATSRRAATPNPVAMRIFDAIRSEAPAIAAPALDRAVADGTISATQRERFLARLEQPDRSAQPAPVPELTHDQRRVSATVFDAIRSQAPAIAQPLLDEAIADGTITPSDADRIRSRLSGRRVRIALRSKSVRPWRPAMPGPAAA